MWAPGIMPYSPFRFRDIRERKNPEAVLFAPGSFGSSSPISWASSAPGKSMSLVMLLTTSSVNTSGFSWRSFSTKKSGLKMMGCLRREESLQMTKLQMASLEKREGIKKLTVTPHYIDFYSQLVCPEGDICWHRSHQSTPTVLSVFSESSVQCTYISLWSKNISGLPVQHSPKLALCSMMVTYATHGNTQVEPSLHLYPASSGWWHPILCINLPLPVVNKFGSFFLPPQKFTPSVLKA